MPQKGKKSTGSGIYKRTEKHIKIMRETSPKYWLGKTLPQGMKDKIGKAHLGKKLSSQHIKHLKEAKSIEYKCPKWKGDNVGYMGVHKWVIKWKGLANHCKICGSTKKRMYHWANIDHTYKRILDDYISMCVPCHKAYDKKLCKKN